MSRNTKCAALLKGSRLYILSILLAFAVSLVPLPLSKGGNEAGAGFLFSRNENMEEEGSFSADRLLVFHENTLLPRSQLKVEKPSVVLAIKEENLVSSERVKVVDVINTTITGYSSTVDQTNCEPFITASGVRVRDGIVAANFLPFDTEIRIPKYFGDKVFIVKDRMNRRHTDRVDIWFPSRQEALNFGIKYTHIEIVETY